MLDNNSISIKGTIKTNNTYEPDAGFIYQGISCYLVKEDYKTVGMLDMENMHNTFFCQINEYLGSIKRGFSVIDKEGNTYHIDGFNKFQEDNYTELTLIMESEWQESN